VQRLLVPDQRGQRRVEQLDVDVRLRHVHPGAVRFPVTGAPAGVQVLMTSAAGQWTLVVANQNATAQGFGVHLNALNQISAASADRTSATESLAPVSLPPVSGATATLSLMPPARAPPTLPPGWTRAS
jgi:hypothetical protein